MVRETQIDWFVKKVHQYLKEKGKTAVGIRRLHYWLLSKEEDDKLMPERGSLVRIYNSIKTESQNIGEKIKEARLQGLLNPSLIIDEKNDPIKGIIKREKARVIDYDKSIETDASHHIYIREMKTWREFIDDLSIEPYIIAEQFTGHTHRLLVVTEKATAEHKIKEVCDKYGANLLVLSGQPSVTRINDFILLSKKEGLPCHIFYIADLDPAGWDMPIKFMENLRILYPYTDHKLDRVLLTREQAIDLKLPVGFNVNEKKYKKPQKRRFIKETESEDCIELDALDEEIILKFLEDQLKKVSLLYKDYEKTVKLTKEVNLSIENAKDSIKTVKYEDQYDSLKEKQFELYKKMKKFKDEVIDEIEELDNDIEELIDSIEKDFGKKLFKGEE